MRSCTCLTFPLWHNSLSTPERSHDSREVAKRRGGHRRFSPLRRRVSVQRRPGPRRSPDAGDDRLQLPRTQLLAAEQGLQSRFDASYEGSTTEEASPRYTRCGSSFVRSFDVLLRADLCTGTRRNLCKSTRSVLGAGALLTDHWPTSKRRKCFPAFV